MMMILQAHLMPYRTLAMFSAACGIRWRRSTRRMHDFRLRCGDISAYLPDQADLLSLLKMGFFAWLFFQVTGGLQCRISDAHFSRRLQNFDIARRGLCNSL